MSIIRNLHAMADALVAASAHDQGILTLGALRERLSDLPADMPIEFDDGRVPGDINSYRGYYERLAIDAGGQSGTVGAVVALLNKADGGTYSGYKGGRYLMDVDTFLHAAEYGDVGEAIVGLSLRDDTAVIQTAEEVW